MLNSWNEKVLVMICLQSNLRHFVSLCSRHREYVFIYRVLYLTVGKNTDLLTGLLVDVNATVEMPAVWESIPL